MYLFLHRLLCSNVDICILKFVDLKFLKLFNRDIVSKYICIATDLYIRLYLYSFGLTLFSFCLIYINKICDANCLSFFILQPIPI